MPELAIIRAVLAAIFLFGSIGSGFELVLLEHVEGFWQSVPVVLIVVGVAALGVLSTRPGVATVRAFQAAMWLFVASGVVGVVMHYQVNVAFELELNPDAAGWDLLWESLKGATPSLAPGTMTLLGTIGLAYTYHHPSIAEQPQNAP